ncbi:BMP family ABC transporter substrate-binding protein [Insolitispirillum peregrinum]
MAMGPFRNVSRRRFTALGSALVAGALAWGSLAPVASAADPLKVGFVYVGPVGDFGWSHQHDEGRKALEAAFGDKVKTAYVEDVPEGADAERVINQFAQQGFDLVFTTSFGFMNPTLKVAKRYPNIKFEHATGYKRADNVATYAARFYEGRAIIGTMAGMMTKSNVLGYIASVPIPEVVQGINAFTLAARKVNPKVQVKVVWVNSWYDPGKEREAAEALIAQGADVLSQHTDSPAPVQAAEEKGIYAFGQASDMAKFGPHAQLTSIVDNWGDYYIARVKAAMDGSWKAIDTWDGLKQGMVHMAPYGAAVPDAVKAKADEVKAGIIAGTLHPFTGPIKNQAGELVVKDGETIPDGQLLTMNWFVEGVQGQLPK